jgi:hypothetical protein
MIKIKICTQNPDGACSYYRSIGVFSKLHKLNSEIVVEIISNFEWSTLSDTDIVVFERPRDESMVKAIEFTQNFGIPVWIDIDDDFFNIPKYNPSYTHFEKKEVRRSIETCIAYADVVSVTTNALKEQYLKYNKNIFVVENAFNDYNFSLSTQPSENNIVNWRGSVTHRNDILSCIESISKLSINHLDYGFNFIGSDLWFIEDRVKNLSIKSPLTLVPYMQYIKFLQPQIQINPLEFNVFNESKSNINFIEGIYAGAVCVAPDMPEWNKPGIEIYRTPEEFYEKVDMLIKDKKKRIKNFYQSLDYINENLLLSRLNKKRLDVIEFLCNDKSI